MSEKQKLELMWVGKDERPKLEPRIFVKDSDLSHSADKRYGESDIFNNILIQGDNLLALKALEQKFVGKIKCIYIDPPYNTGNAFEHYDDGLEQSIWLGLIRDRLELLKNLLAQDGVIFISIEEVQGAYLRMVADEVFGKRNYCGNFVWEKKRKPSFLNSRMGVITEQIVSYAKSIKDAPEFTYGETSGEETYPLYNAGNKRGVLTLPPGSVHFKALADGVHPPKAYPKKTSVVKLVSRLKIKDGRNDNELKIEGEWRYSQSAVNEQIKNGDYYVVRSKELRPRRVLTNGSKKKKVHNLISRAHYDMATYEDATSESQNLFGKDKFDYPKPEKLIEFLIGAATRKGDLVLDSFGGSGTTAAVAHKMNRHWIMVELGEQAETHIVPRLKKVIDGKDDGGITKSVDWKGGGGFQFYRLAPSLLEKDSYGNWIISKEYDANMLAAAMCKVMGFIYHPSETDYWNHGHSTESDFIFVTTNAMTHEELVALSDRVGSERTLLVCCKAFNSKSSKFENLTLEKIPQAVLDKCEWAKDDYSLNVSNLPVDDEDE